MINLLKITAKTTLRRVFLSAFLLKIVFELNIFFERSILDIFVKEL